MVSLMRVQHGLTSSVRVGTNAQMFNTCPNICGHKLGIGHE